MEDALPGQGRAIGEGQPDRLVAGPLTVRFPKVTRSQPIAGAKQGVEAPDAGEAAGKSDVDNWQRRLRQELLGEQEPERLRQLDRRDSQLLSEHPSEVPRADAQ